LTRTLFIAGGIALAGPSSDALAATDLMGNDGQPIDLSGARVDLTISMARSPFAVGSVDGKPADFRGTPYGGTVTGSMLRTELKADVVQRDQVPHGSDYLTTTHVSGSFGSVPTKLLGNFSLDSSYLFKKGTVTGRTGQKSVEVVALPHADPETSSAVTVAGRFGATTFSLVAILPVGGRGSISGSVASKAVHLDVTPLESDLLTIRFTGTYSGPSDLLALIVGAVSYFGG
jgi:hypothetical protein